MGAFDAQALGTETAEDDYLRHELRFVVREVVGSLPGSEAAVVQYLYFDELSLTAAARKLGYDKSWACRLHQRAMNRLSTRLKRALR